MSFEIYDIETLKSCFTYTGLNVSTKEIKQFVIHKDRDDSYELMHHLLSLKWGVGFNNINFDYPILHYFIKTYKNDILNSSSNLSGVYGYNVEELILDLFNKAQQIIEEQNKEDFFTTVAIKELDCYFKQLDLFKIWHYNNKARRTSLKALEISMNLPNVMEMEVDYKRDDIRLDEIEGILEYNKNDVIATYEFYLKSIDKLKLRKDLNAQYNLNCLNFPDVKIGETLMLKLYCDKTETNWFDIKKLRTYRKSIKLKECIFDYIKFETEIFQDLLKYLNNTTINNTKDSFSTKVIFNNIRLDYGTGGIHACTYSGIYESTDTHIIKSCDVASLYPNLGIKNKVYPEHLGPVFYDIYENDIVKVRLEAKKKGNKLIADALKLAANGAYGKSNDENSFLYDPKYTMQITINGQLSLSMLIETLGIHIEDIKFLMVNTDGLEVIIRKDQEELYYKICKDWEEKTKLELEFADYKKLIIGDVNNYIGLFTNNKKKYKGRFEIDKFVGDEPAYHKNNSFRIIPLALSEYFINNIPVEQTIRNHNNIFDFCGRQKFDSKSYGETNTLMYDSSNNPYNKIEKQQRNTRYYIINKGSTFIKRYNKGTSEAINKGYQVKIFNKFEEKQMKEYDINYNFYIRECQKEIKNIISDQMSLF